MFKTLPCHNCSWESGKQEEEVEVAEGEGDVQQLEVCHAKANT